MDEHTLTTTLSRIRGKIETDGTVYIKPYMAWDINGPEVKQHDRKENLCKKDIFLADCRHGTLNDRNILVSFFLTKNIAVLWVGLALTVCAALWMLFMVQLLGMRLSNFTSELCQILDDMMNRSQEPENVSDRETIFARIPSPPGASV